MLTLVVALTLSQWQSRAFFPDPDADAKDAQQIAAARKMADSITELDLDKVVEYRRIRKQHVDAAIEEMKRNARSALLLGGPDAVVAKGEEAAAKQVGLDADRARSLSYMAMGYVTATERLGNTPGVDVRREFQDAFGQHAAELFAIHEDTLRQKLAAYVPKGVIEGWRPPSTTAPDVFGKQSPSAAQTDPSEQYFADQADRQARTVAPTLTDDDLKRYVVYLRELRSHPVKSIPKDSAMEPPIRSAMEDFLAQQRQKRAVAAAATAGIPAATASALNTMLLSYASDLYEAPSEALRDARRRRFREKWGADLAARVAVIEPALLADQAALRAVIADGGS